MKPSKNYYDYSGYEYNDFVCDDYFISSVTNPTGETESFWNGFLAAYPGQEEKFAEASGFVRSLITDCIDVKEPAEKELSETWSRIKSACEFTGRKISLRRRIYITVTAVAASILILLALLPITLFKNEDVTAVSEIVAFAMKDNNATADTEDGITMVFSGIEKTVVLEDGEADVAYTDDLDVSSVNYDKNKTLQLPTDGISKMVIPKGKRSSIIFSDGTKMWVNGGSRVTFPTKFADDLREIFVDGEAYLEVAHDENRPFFVRTNDLSVRVLGTKFNITAYSSDNYKNVVLVSGKVAVNVEGAKEPALILRPNQKLEYRKGTDSASTISITDINVAGYISWKDGFYIYENETLAVILQRLSRYYGITINCDKEYANIKCSGKLNMKDDPADIISGICFLSSLDCKNVDGSYFIYKE